MVYTLPQKGGDTLDSRVYSSGQFAEIGPVAPAGQEAAAHILHRQRVTQVVAPGAVDVQVLIDESGNVISAHALTGHPLLQAAAEAAAKASKFTPTLKSGVAVKVRGMIIYNFFLL